MLIFFHIMPNKFVFTSIKFSDFFFLASAFFDSILYPPQCFSNGFNHPWSLLDYLIFYMWSDIYANWYLHRVTSLLGSLVQSNPVQQPWNKSSVYNVQFLLCPLSFIVNTYGQQNIRGTFQNTEIVSTTPTLTAVPTASEINTSYTMSTKTEHNELHSERIYCRATGNSCVTIWWLVACAETGCGSNVRCQNMRLHCL